MNAVQQPLVVKVEAAGFIAQAVTLQPLPQALVETTTRRKPVVVTEAQMHRVNLQEFVLKQEHKIVSFTFTKLDGSTRNLTGRLGVRKHLKGGTNTVEREDRPYLTVYDLQAKGYRAVNLETVTSVRAQHMNYKILG